MSNAVFPTLAGISWGIVKAPQWNTRVQRSISFMETRIAFASLPQWRWSVPFQFLRVADPFEYQTLASFYNDRKGRWDSFLYSDPVDSSVTDMNFGTGDGSTTQFQLGRRLLAGGLLEPIYNVLVLTNIKKNGVVQTNPANYSISATGLVTFGAAPANGAALTWTGTYYWRVRFDQDAADFSEFANGFWSLGELAFVSVKGS
jgi:uncharacterized protein (TIGR02217 family)